MARTTLDLLQGTLDLLVLKTPAWGPTHGYGVARGIQYIKGSVLRVKEGSLYPALERLLNKGWVTVEWAETPTKRQARYYTITRSGRTQLKERVSDIGQLRQAIDEVARGGSVIDPKVVEVLVEARTRSHESPLRFSCA